MDTSPTPLPRQAINVPPGQPDAFEAWRWAVSPVYDMDAATADARSAYSLQSEGFRYGDMPISATRFSASRFDRNAPVIARAGLDSVMVQVYEDGAYRFEAEGEQRVARIGDIVAFDYTRCSRILTENSAAISVIVPRHLLTPLTNDLDDIHGLVLPHATSLNTLLVSHLRLLVTEVPRLNQVHGSAIAKTTAALVAACFVGAKQTLEQARASLAAGVLRMMRRTIEENLANPDLGPNMLAKQFHVSRAQLYRLFQPLGGVRHYIHQRRLNRVHQALADPRLFHQGIMTIAQQYGFSNKTVLSRAHRALYGLSPSDFRHMARSGEVAAPNGSGAVTGSFNDVYYWTQLRDAVG